MPKKKNTVSEISPRYVLIDDDDEPITPVFEIEDDGDIQGVVTKKIEEYVAESNFDNGDKIALKLCLVVRDLTVTIHTVSVDGL